MRSFKRTATLTFLFLLTGVATAVDSESRFGAKLEKLSEALVEQLDLPKNQGLLLTKVKADSPAAKAGLKNNDVLLELGGKAVPNNLPDLNKMMDDIKPDSTVDALVLRKGKKELVKDVTLPEGKPEEKKLGKRPLPGPNPKTAENLKKALEGLGQGIFPGGDPNDVRKLLENLQGGGKKGPDLDQIRKLMEKLGGAGGGGAPNPDQLKKMLERFGGGGGAANPDQLKKLLENFQGGGGGGGGLDPSKLLEQFGGQGLGDLLKKKAAPKDDAKPEEKKPADEPKKKLDIRFSTPETTLRQQLDTPARVERAISMWQRATTL